MKNYQISSGQIPFLVNLTADLFNKMNTEIKSIGATAYVPQHIHFVADLLKDLVETAYPVKEEPQVKCIKTKKEILDKEIEKVAEIMKGYAPPIFYVEVFKDGDF